MIDIAARRLAAQRLTGEPCASAVDVVRWLGAVQSQDYGAAKWAVGQRTREATEVDLDGLLDRGDILRTHVLRPTWHFVLPGDIRWLLDLTGSRIRRSLVARYRQLEIDEQVVSRAKAAFTAALAGGRHLTRLELGDVLRVAGITPDGQRLPHLLMAAELDGLITSGPRHGKQFSYALLSDRAPNAPTLERTDALAELARRYFRSRGPAQLQDFTWWSGLTTSDARAGIALAGHALEHQVIDGTEYWFGTDARPVRRRAAVAHLVPNFDEYTVAYRDRSATVHPDRPVDPALLAFGSVLSNVVLVDGRVRGAWSRTVTSKTIRVHVRHFVRPTAAETGAVEDAGRRLGRFLGSPLQISWR